MGLSNLDAARLFDKWEAGVLWASKSQIGNFEAFGEIPAAWVARNEGRYDEKTSNKYQILIAVSIMEIIPRTLSSRMDTAFKREAQGPR